MAWVQAERAVLLQYQQQLAGKEGFAISETVVCVGCPSTYLLTDRPCWSCNEVVFAHDGKRSHGKDSCATVPSQPGVRKALPLV